MAFYMGKARAYYKNPWTELNMKNKETKWHVLDLPPQSSQMKVFSVGITTPEVIRNPGGDDCILGSTG